MNEFELIHQYLKQSEPPSSAVRVGHGDDCAVFAVRPEYELCVSVDATLEGRHVPVGTSGDLFAQRAFRRALSDLAACGATPKYLLSSLSSTDLAPQWVRAFGETVRAQCGQWKMTLLGGDLSKGPTAAHLTVFGEVPAGQAMTRGGAQEGDAIVYFGTDCGGARAYLEVLSGHPAVPLWHTRYWFPEPQCVLGEQLRGHATACIDVSDGLLQDLMHLLAAASAPLCAELRRDAVPLCAGLTEAFGATEALRMALTGGDDYGLIATLPKHHPLVASGHFLGTLSSAPAPCLSLDGQPVALTEWAGWDHGR